MNWGQELFIWRRWLFWFWLALTLVWVVGGELALWVVLDAEWDVFWDTLIGGAWAVLVVPPVVVFVLGWLVLWSFGVFRQDKG